jgi:TatD DNase family protein
VNHPRFVDFHCHLDLYPNHAEAVAERERDKVFTLTVTTTPLAWARNQELASATKYVRAALGLHPQLVAERAGELSLWEKLLPQARYVGEVGLDAGPRYYRSIDLQKKVFERVLCLCAETGGKVLTIHSVRATTLVLDMIQAHLPQDRGRPVLHWFTGTKAEARRAIDLGCYFSINPEMLRNERHASLVATLPIDRLLTETDGPFVKVEGRIIGPQDSQRTVAMLARVLSCDVDDLIAKIIANLKHLVS